MKKRILSVSLVAIFAIVAIAGASLAYLQDTDAQTNTFVVGEVKIDLFEDFNTENLHLIPAVPYTDPDTGVEQWRNQIEKEVYVKNTGINDAFVRVHIAIPAFQKNSTNINAIALDFDDQTTVNGKWIWGNTLDSNYPPRDGGEWNVYRDITINGIPYKVFVVTYETAIAKDEITPDAIDSIHMDPTVTNEDIAGWNTLYGKDEWAKVYVVAEAVQADGWDDPITALNTAFGDPSATDYQLPDFTAASEGDIFVERTSNDGN